MDNMSPSTSESESSKLKFHVAQVLAQNVKEQRGDTLMLTNKPTKGVTVEKNLLAQAGPGEEKFPSVMNLDTWHPCTEYQQHVRSPSFLLPVPGYWGLEDQAPSSWSLYDHMHVCIQ
jgi:hypothetical protein